MTTGSRKTVPSVESLLRPGRWTSSLRTIQSRQAVQDRSGFCPQRQNLKKLQICCISHVLQNQPEDDLNSSFLISFILYLILIDFSFCLYYMESYFTGFKINQCLKEESQHRHDSDSLTGMTQFLPQFQSELWTGPARVNFLPSSSSNRFSLAHKYLKHWNTFWPRLLRHSATRRGGFGSAVLHHVCLQVPPQVQVLLLAT